MNDRYYFWGPLLYHSTILNCDEILKDLRTIGKGELAPSMESVDCGENLRFNVGDKLVVKEAYCGKQIVMKRFRPRAKGRASGIKKPYSRVTIILEEKQTKDKTEDKK